MESPTPLVATTPGTLLPARIATGQTPALFAGSQACERRFWEFFAANIRNKNTRQAYLTACFRFADWCEVHRIALDDVNPLVVAAYVELLTDAYAATTVKQRLAAIRMLFDFLLIGQILATNPASAVRGPRHSTQVGKTPGTDSR